MGNHSDHGKKCQHNQQFLDSFDHDQFPDWAVVVAFYKAVHLVEMLFDKAQHYHSDSHSKRNYKLRRNYKPIWKNFRPLYNLSLVARYQTSSINRKEQQHVLTTLLPALESLVATEIAALP